MRYKNGNEPIPTDDAISFILKLLSHSHPRIQCTRRYYYIPKESLESRTFLQHVFRAKFRVLRRIHMQYVKGVARNIHTQHIELCDALISTMSARDSDLKLLINVTPSEITLLRIHGRVHCSDAFSCATSFAPEYDYSNLD